MSSQNPSPFIPTPQQGTHFSDGVRVGPIVKQEYVAKPQGGYFQPPVPEGNLFEQSLANGVLIGPEVIYSVTPWKANVGAFMEGTSASDVQGDGFLDASSWIHLTVPTDGSAQLIPLRNPVSFGSSGPGYGDTTLSDAYPIIQNNTFTQGILLDCSRCISLAFQLNMAGNVTDDTIVNVTATAYGIDMYGQPVASQIILNLFVGETGVSAATCYVVFPKSMRVLLGVYIESDQFGAANAASLKSLNIGTSDVFGMPYRFDNFSQVFSMWNGVPLYSSSTIPYTAAPAVGDVIFYPLTVPSSVYNMIDAGTTGDIPALLTAFDIRAQFDSFSNPPTNKTFGYDVIDSSGVAIHLQGNDQSQAGGIGFGNLLTADPGPYGLICPYNRTAPPTVNPNLNPKSTITSGDVRGLVGLPYYYGDAASGSDILTVNNASTYNGTTNYYQSPALTVRMFVPGALNNKRAMYPNPVPNNAPAGTVPGSPIYGTPWIGATDSVPVETPTMPIDLYGSPQYWPS